MIGRGRSGIVLPAVLLVLILGTLLSHAAFVIARAEMRLAGLGRSLLRAELAAEAGLVRARAVLADTSFRGEAPDARDRVAWGETAGFTLRLMRLAPEVFLAISEGRVRGLPEPVRIGQLLWRLDPAARVAAVRGVVEAPRVTTGPVRNLSWTAIPAGADSAACRALLDEVAAIGGTTPAGIAEGAFAPQLGRMELEELLAVADHTTSGVVTPGVVESEGQCAIAVAANWGDPERSGAPCSGHHPIIGSPGSLRVEGGVGQGLIVASGGITLTDGAFFRGGLVADGPVRVQSGARLEGWVRSGAPVTVTGGGRILGSACGLGMALAARTVLRGPRALEGDRRVFLP